ncbi:hypothetical protein DEU29_10349 [Idiomarina aquatica]|uniref:Uncharacterized protein n=1 Tax=Idiomarina aquatica TaxID=1327752 RepID=A0A4R6PLR0_9GAMM|nr:hypothetical protein [Idiomarina aquatica]TDP39154.1 hypothetical protein DEU29_10349 [Idiomarina aquatica]
MLKKISGLIAVCFVFNCNAVDWENSEGLQKVQDVFTKYGSPEAVETKFGKPSSTLQKSIQMPGSDRFDTLLTLEYPTQLFRFHIIAGRHLDRKNDKVMLDKVVVTGCGPNFEFADITCQGRQNLIDALGQPEQDSDNILHYQITFGDMGSSPSYFEISDFGYVSRIEYHTFID